MKKKESDAVISARVAPKIISLGYTRGEVVCFHFKQCELIGKLISQATTLFLSNVLCVYYQKGSLTVDNRDIL